MCPNPIFLYLYLSLRILCQRFLGLGKGNICLTPFIPFEQVTVFPRKNGRRGNISCHTGWPDSSRNYNFCQLHMDSEKFLTETVSTGPIIYCCHSAVVGQARKSLCYINCMLWSEGQRTMQMNNYVKFINVILLFAANNQLTINPKEGKMPSYQ